MSESQIRFEDGAAYERMMGVWSRLVGNVFLDWLAPEQNQNWIDVGCGNGAFTELLVQRCQPAEILGIDPSEGQLSFARSRVAGIARFEQGDAMALPYADNSLDVAVMALVIFFVPDPARGVAEMKRVVKPGGSISAYVWDVLEPGGFPMAALQEELRNIGITPMLPPRAEVSRLGALHTLWVDAGLTDVASREIVVTRTFDDFADFWVSAEIAIGMGQGTRDMSVETRANLKDRLKDRLPVDAGGRISFASRANAVTGRVPVGSSIVPSEAI
ncbi:class I SAM-dependent methyltransferase [Sphingomonas sp.]|uniref:class I SAM-dependent methyltransferase n=1 Tax=Sphingomonas sp. TaxID=28214 RepID=UPI0025DEEF85|nr:class I SAM-dependent methyltransferase [Sphingomonas sp.]